MFTLTLVVEAPLGGQYCGTSTTKKQSVNQKDQKKIHLSTSFSPTLSGRKDNENKKSKTFPICLVFFVLLSSNRNCNYTDSKWGSSRLTIGHQPLVDARRVYVFRTPGSFPSQILSFLLSLFKNAMTSANRCVNSYLPAGAYAGRLPRHSIFIFTPSPFLYITIGPRFISNPPESQSTHLSIFPSYLVMPTLCGPQEKTIMHSNESTRHSHTKRLEVMLYQRDPLIALIGLIMVISTRTEIAVILCLVLKSNYLTISNISHRARLPRQQEETKTYPNESSCQRHFKTMEVDATAEAMQGRATGS